MSFVEVKNVSYKKGRKVIYQNLNFNLDQGKIVALLGENGSGKTTIMRLLAGLALNFQGEITIDQVPVGKNTKAAVALLADLSNFPEDYQVQQVLNFYADFYENFEIG